MSPTIEVIARGAWVEDGRVLLCHSLVKGHTYLPGGHVEKGESIRGALAREIEEELGARVRVGEFLGVLEYSFHDGVEKHVEVNFLFRVSLEIGEGDRFRSREEEIEFFLCDLPRLGEVDFLPAPLVELLPEWLADPRPGRFSSRLDA